MSARLSLSNLSLRNLNGRKPVAGALEISQAEVFSIAHPGDSIPRRPISYRLYVISPLVLTSLDMGGDKRPPDFQNSSIFKNSPIFKKLFNIDSE